eukprot:GEMP01040680.1.p1 GENE.GEMP01040680.1~~GEMP01040680.1.p1  ORF type:complete len:341 (+),score=82.94 GEMP01040680.1:154-1176(+)
MDLLPPELAEVLSQIAAPAMSILLGAVGLAMYFSSTAKQRNEAYGITALYIYPVLNCRGVEVSRLMLDWLGPAGSPRYVILRVRDNTPISLESGSASLNIIPVMDGDQVVALAASKMERLMLSECQRQEGTTFRYEGRDWKGALINGAQEWLGKALETDGYALYELAAPSQEIAGAASGSFSIVHKESMDDIQGQCDMMMDDYFAHRFRPNIVVDGGKSFDEDLWKQLDVVSRMGWCAGKVIPFRVQTPSMQSSAVNACPNNGKLEREEKNLLTFLRKWRMPIDTSATRGACPFFGFDIKYDCDPAEVQGAMINVGDGVSIKTWVKKHPLKVDNVAKMYV